MQQVIQEVSTGGVVYRRIGEPVSGQGQYEFLVGKHSGYHKWVLPKGLVEKGESYIEAAEREVEEEVGVKARATTQQPIKTIEYWYYADLEKKIGVAAGGTDSERRVKKYQEAGGAKSRIHKKVSFYLMEVESELERVGWEMEERRWVTYEEGRELLAFESEREVLMAAKDALD